MKALRIKAYQETTCYTKPFANKVTETYPLPPYATVKGMIHVVMDAKQLIPFSLSIQGDYESMIVDYRKTYFVKKKEFNMPIVLEGLSTPTPEFKNMTSMPLYSHLLYNVDLVIHVQAEEEILLQIYEAFKNNDQHISLGRQEDLLRLDDIGIVNIEELDIYDEGANLKHSMYIPTNKVYKDERAEGIPYLLNWTYEIKHGIREWERIPSTYFDKGKLIDQDLVEEPVYIDSDGYVIVWNV